MHFVENCLRSKKNCPILLAFRVKGPFHEIECWSCQEKFSPAAGNLTCPEIDNCFSHLTQVFKILLACGELQNLFFFSFVEH